MEGSFERLRMGAEGVGFVGEFGVLGGVLSRGLFGGGCGVCGVGNTRRCDVEWEEIVEGELTPCVGWWIKKTTPHTNPGGASYDSQAILHSLAFSRGCYAARRTTSLREETRYGGANGALLPLSPSVRCSGKVARLISFPSSRPIAQRPEPKGGRAEGVGDTPHKGRFEDETNILGRAVSGR